MTRPEPISYETIFARSVPPPRPAPVRRGKYDFAVAGRRRAYYPDGEDALILSAQGIGADSQRRRRELRDALRERGLRVRHQGKSQGA